MSDCVPLKGKLRDLNDSRINDKDCPIWEYRDKGYWVNIFDLVSAVAFYKKYVDNLEYFEDNLCSSDPWFDSYVKYAQKIFSKLDKNRDKDDEVPPFVEQMKEKQWWVYLRLSDYDEGLETFNMWLFDVAFEDVVDG